MKRTLDQHAARFSEEATEYDQNQDSKEYRECVSLVLDHAAPTATDTVLDLGTGTGVLALALSSDAKQVLGRDISDGMMAEAQKKADADGIENVAFEHGTFREPNVDEPVDVVVSNFAMHHLSDEEKRAAIDIIAGLEPRRFVLGDVMFFGESDPEVSFYSPEVDDPATVGVLADALTDAGFSLTAVEFVHGQVGVLVAERATHDRADAAIGTLGTSG